MTGRFASRVHPISENEKLCARQKSEGECEVVGDDVRSLARVCPGGTLENSPAFQRWVRGSVRRVPKGRQSCARSSAVPAGLMTSTGSPSVETLGYFRVSLRDKDSSRRLLHGDVA